MRGIARECGIAVAGGCGVGLLFCAHKEEYFIFGAVCLCPLFCDLESGSEDCRRSENQCLSVSGSGGHHCSFSPGPPRKNISGVCSWDRDGAYGAGSLRQREDSGKN